MMTLQHLRDLLAVVAHGGFRSASRALGVSQAGLTKGVACLESECGGSLIERSAKGIKLTSLGEAFLPYAKSVLFEADRATDWMRQTGARLPQTVGLGVSPDPSLHLAPAVIADFRQALPDVTVRIFQGSPSELSAALRDNRIDIAVMRLPTHMEASDLRIDPLYDAEAAVVARVGHPLKQALSVRDLIELDWVVVGDPAVPAQDDASIRELFLLQQLDRPRVAVVSNSMFGTVSMLLASDCVARLPRAILTHPITSYVLSEIAVQEQKGLSYQVGLATKVSKRLGREAKLLASMLRSYARVTHALGR